MLSIHQFHSGTSAGDAVTNSLFLIKDLFRTAGIHSEIFAEHIPEELRGLVLPFTDYLPEEDHIMLVHHSMGHEQSDWVLHLPVTKILVYHNITPPDFFPSESLNRYYAQKGRDQLQKFASVMTGGIADSEFNARELEKSGYANVQVLPLLFNIGSLWARAADPDILQLSDHSLTILFVGRIAPNKCQHKLVRILAELQQMTQRSCRLVLVGNYEESDSYYREIRNDIISLGLEQQVIITGKISDAELTAWYKVADAFVCMSEHEGFGVPLIEAMVYDLPVIACKNSNIPATMAGAGLVVDSAEIIEVAALLKTVIIDRPLRRSLIQFQRERIAELTWDKLAKNLFSYLNNRGVSLPEISTKLDYKRIRRKCYQIEGPIETSYSLALVNRELAFALARKFPGKVGLFATEGPGDYHPAPGDIDAIPGLSDLVGKGSKRSRADVVIRNLYPPRVVDMDGLINLFYFAWEESGLPYHFVDNFNIYLDGMPVLSRFVKKILIDHGIKLPVAVAGCGYDHVLRIQPETFSGTLPSCFKFLHISSCFPRKGVDVLLEAFCRVFTAGDDVALVVKTFPNIHNNIREQIEEIKRRYENAPAIVLIEEDLPPGQVVDLYRSCDVFVAPSRGEGFGLPMAEAIEYGLPVITTGYGGQTDFCTDETSWLIDYTFEAAKTHLNLWDSVWVEPDINHLGQLMREIRQADRSDLSSRVERGQKLLRDKFTWEICAERVVRLEKWIKKRKPLQDSKIRLAWISPWNVKCGIATYSLFLLQAMKDYDFETMILASDERAPVGRDEDNVIRCWTNKKHQINHLVETLTVVDPDVCVIQFNWAFYALDDLARLIGFIKKKKKVVVVIFHVTKDLPPPHGPATLQSIAEDLSLVDRILVHGIEDLNRLKKWGLVDNVTLFPHGVRELVSLDTVGTRISYGIPEGAFVIASYGFLLPHKGIDSLIESFSILRKKHKNFDLRLILVTALYPEPLLSEAYKERCRRMIEEFGIADAVIFETDFLTDEESISLLGMADLLVFPYQDTAESASGAIRYALSMGIPTAVTPLQIFDDVKDIVHILPGTTVGDIADGIENILFHPQLLQSKRLAQEKWINTHTWSLLGKRLAGILHGLVINSELNDS